MASLIPGFEYDVFISYRQKDNKHDGWVTEFVDNLKGELESTFKEEISVYFDVNPHDGLLETHDVDASLKEKLKCLIFIPIISRTYCDPKSFAWEHEFKAFVDLASKDQFGLKIKLPNGNVASRVLPLRIHDLDIADIKECESVLGGVLRGIEFIYKEPGVNRPLKPDDDEKINLTKTKYRNQINKVANAIKDIITGMGQYIPQRHEGSIEILTPKFVQWKNLKIKIFTVSIFVLLLIFLGFILIPKLLKLEEQPVKSIAVLPFKLLSNETDKQYLADGMMDAILLHLQKFNGLQVISRTSLEQYKGTTKTIHVIGKELDVGYLLEGSFQKIGDSVRLIIQLIRTRDDNYIWANEYKRNWRDVFSVQSEVAQYAAKELYTAITPEEKRLTENIPTLNLNAYDLYMQAKNFEDKYYIHRDKKFYENAVILYNEAIEIDSSYAKAYTGLASLYYERYFWETYFKQNFLDSVLTLCDKALSFDNQLDEAYFLKGQYYRENGNSIAAIENYDKTLTLNPNYYWSYYFKGSIYSDISSDLVKALENYNQALLLIRGNDRPRLLRNLYSIYLDAGFIDTAKYYLKKAYQFDNDKTIYLFYSGWIEFCRGNFEEALNLAKVSLETDSTRYTDLMWFSIPPGHDTEAFIQAKKILRINQKLGVININQAGRIGYAFYKVGKYKEADMYLKQQISYCENLLKLGRTNTQKKSTQYDLAATYAFLGDKVKAYKYLDEFNTMNFYPLWWLELAKNDPLFSNIRSEEHFQRILQNMEAKYQAEHERVRKWLEEQGKL